MLIRLILAFGTISIFVCGTTYLILKRRLNLSPVQLRFMKWFFVFSAFSIVAGPIIYRIFRPTGDAPIQYAFQFFQYFIMGWVGVNLIILGLIEILNLMAKPFDPSKRIFLSEGLTKGVLLSTSTIAFGGWLEADAGPSIVPIDIKLPTLPQAFRGFQIAQISDVHIGPLLHRAFLDRVVDQVMSLNADAIFITGDLVDGSVAQLKEQMEPLRRLKAKDGVYFCTGNHEFYSGVEEWIHHLESMNIHVFKNSNVILKRMAENETQNLMIAGAHDWHGHQFSDAFKTSPTLAAQTTENVSCKILLAHNPFSIVEAAEAGFDLQISGHTHAGQFYPFVFLVKLRLKHSEGHYVINDKTQLYVNRGTGYWGPPNRLGKKSEITHFTLS